MTIEPHPHLYEGRSGVECQSTQGLQETQEFPDGRWAVALSWSQVWVQNQRREPLVKRAQQLTGGGRKNKTTMHRIWVCFSVALYYIADFCSVFLAALVSSVGRALCLGSSEALVFRAQRRRYYKARGFLNHVPKSA